MHTPLLTQKWARAGEPRHGRGPRNQRRTDPAPVTYGV